MKKIIFLALTVLVLISVMVSCTVDGNDNTDNPGGNSQTPSGGNSQVEDNGEYVFSDGSTLKIVASAIEASGERAEEYNALVQKIYSAIAYGSGNVSVDIISDTQEAAAHEIIIGESSRPLSKRAYTRLSRLDLADGEAGFVVCSDGRSIAIAFSTDADYEAPEIAVERFIADYVTDKAELVLSSDHVYQSVYDPIEYFAERDEAIVAEEWALLEAVVTKDMTASLGADEAAEYAAKLISSLKRLYSLYDDSIVEWLANLYEPYTCVCTAIEGEDHCLGTKYCGGAGFYYSNSGRNTRGYMPDIETTSQAIGFLTSTGMLKLEGGRLRAAFPSGEAEKMVRYIKSLQDERTGFFYHPQWEIETLQTSRTARDLNYGISVLRQFGAKPTYDAPDGTKGDGILYDGTRLETDAPASRLTRRFSSASVAALVSLVKPTAGSYSPDYLLSKENFAAYLEGLDVRNDSYYAGNELASTASQIINRDNYLKSIGADYSLIDMAVEYLDANQNPENGTWDYKKDGDNGYTPYLGNDGVLKIVSFYNSVKRPMNHALPAVQNAISTITVDYTPGHVCNVYNGWLAVTQILSNIRTYGDPSEADAVRAELRLIAPEAIVITQEKLSLFQKEDKSFSYFKNTSASGSQGAPVAIPDTNEGDVNATVICTYGTVDFLFHALGWRDYMVSLYTDSDRREFKEIISKLSPVVKNMEFDPSEPVTFDNEILGNIPGEVLHYGGKFGFEVVRRQGEDYAARVDSPAGAYSVVEVSTVSGLGGRTFVFGGDFRINSAPDNGYIVQINMGRNAYTTTVCMLAFKMEDGMVTIWEATSNEGKAYDVNTRLAEASLGEWFNIRAEYFVGDHDTVRIKYFFNDKLVAVTDNYYDQYGEKLKNGTGVPNDGFDRTRIAVLSNVDVEMDMDNLSGYKKREKYKPSDDPTLTVNVDAPAEEERIYFSDDVTELPPEFTVEKGADALEVVSVDDNSALKFTAAEGADLLIPATLRNAAGRCASIGFDIILDTVSTGKLMHISLLNRCVGDLHASGASKKLSEIFNLAFKIVEEGSEEYFVVYEYANNTYGRELYRDRASTEKFSIRLDYFADRGTAVLYVNGSLPIVSKATSDFASRYNFGNFRASFEGGSNALLLDNLKVELGTRDFDSDMSPAISSEYHTFESGYGKVTVSDTDKAKVVDGTGGKLLSINGGVRVSAPVLDRSPVFNASVFEAKLKLDSGDARIEFTDGSGNTVFALDLVLKNGKVNIYEVGKSTASDPYRRYSYVLASAEAGKQFTVRVELFRADGIALIYIDGKEADATSIVYDAEGLAGDYENLVISTSGATALTVDDIKAETLYSYYILPEIKKENTEDASATLTYDDSAILNLPAAVTGEFYSAKAAYKIKQMLKRIGSTAEYDKVLVFEKDGNNYDYAWINSTAPKNASMYVFETDMMVETDMKNQIFCQMLLGDKSNRSSFAYYLLLSINADGYVCFSESSSLNGDGNHRRWTSSRQAAKVGEWFNLRVEYFTGTKNTVRIKIYLNGELIGVSDNYYGWHAVDNPSATPSNFFDRLQLYSWKGKCNIYLDNTLIKADNGRCTDDVTFTYKTP